MRPTIKVKLGLIVTMMLVAITALGLYAVWFGQQAIQSAVGQETINSSLKAGLHFRQQVQFFLDYTEQFTLNPFVQAALFEANLNPATENAADDMATAAPPHLHETGDPSSRGSEDGNLSNYLKRRFLDFWNLKKGYQVYDAVVIADAQGRVVARMEKIDVNNSHLQSVCQEIRSKSFHLGTIFRGEDRNRLLLPVAFAVKGDDGQYLGCIVSFLSLGNIIRETVVQLSGYQTTEVRVVDPVQQTLVYATRAHIPLTDVSVAPFFVKLTEKGRFFTMEEGHRKKLFGYYGKTDQTESNPLDFYFVMSYDASEILQPFYKLRTAIVTGTLVLSVFFLVFILLLARSITGPLNQLEHSMKVVGEGNLDHRIDLASNDEIGLLAGIFDDTVAKLKQTMTSRDSLKEEIALRKQYEKQLREKNEELNRSNTELQQFAYVASHDLQEPLRMVASYTQLLQQKYGDKLDDKARKYIHYAADGALRMQRLIHDLLDYSRVSTKGVEFKPEDAHNILGRAIVNLEMMITERNAMVTNGELPMINVDASQIVQVFQNLMSNGIKFCTLEIPLIHVSAIQSNGSWCFSIKDNGIGIEKAYAEKIFIIFQRLHTREEYPGTGIGLALCKRIIERHGGEIWFESEPNEGTTFHFTLPGVEHSLTKATTTESE